MIYVLGRTVGQLEPTQCLSLDPANAHKRNDFVHERAMGALGATAPDLSGPNASPALLVAAAAQRAVAKAAAALEGQ